MRFLTRILKWLGLPGGEADDLYEWASAKTSIANLDKRAFVHALSLVGGIVGQHHPRFKQMQKDYLAWKERSHDV